MPAQTRQDDTQARQARSGLRSPGSSRRELGGAGITIDQRYNIEERRDDSAQERNTSACSVDFTAIAGVGTQRRTVPAIAVEVPCTASSDRPAAIIIHADTLRGR